MRFLRNKKPSDFLRNVATLATGTTLAQAVSIFTAPILYRIYDKTDYGTLGVYIAFTGVVGVFSTMQYLQTILLEKNDKDAKVALWLNRSINIVIAAIVLLVVLLLNDFIADVLNNAELAKWLYLAPISVFFAGQNEIFRVWANRKKKYKILSFNAILTAILVPIISISVGLIYPEYGALGLFLGLLTSHVFPPLVMLIALRSTENFKVDNLSLQYLQEVAKKYKDFPKFSLPSEFINRFSNQLPVFMLSTFAGAGVVGVYNLAVRMLGLPITLIGNAIAEVFRQKATEDYHRKGENQDIFKKTFKILTSISVFPLIIILLWGPDLFTLVFGDNWKEAGVFAQILSGYFFLRLIVSPLSYQFIISRKLREDMIWHLWMLISNVILFLVGFQLTENYLLIMGIFSINYIGFYIIYLFRSFKFSKGY